MDLMNQGPLHVIMLGFTVKMLDTDQCCSCPAELETEFVIVVMELTSGAQVRSCNEDSSKIFGGTMLRIY